tara:strand:- start:348 stop:680 length:333 start_codon:yes stop_codon:yes gene_type:complete
MRGRRAELKECLVRCSCGAPCVAVGGAPPTISLVTTHYAEPFGWLKPVLARHERLDVVIYECLALSKASPIWPVRQRGPTGGLAEAGGWSFGQPEACRTLSDLVFGAGAA